MISHHQAEIIAFVGDGGIIHAECVDRDIRHNAGARSRAKGPDNDALYYAILEEEQGLTPLTRFEVHEIESANYSDIEYSLFDNVDNHEFDEDNVDYTAETYTLTMDLAPLVGVYCDQCGERIE